MPRPAIHSDHTAEAISYLADEPEPEEVAEADGDDFAAGADAKDAERGA